MVSKRERNHLVKAYNKSITAKQSQITVHRQKIVILKDDEFTEHPTIKNLLMDFAWNARERERDYQAHKSQMIKAVALAMEDELKNMGKPELVCHICEELMNVLKQARVNWSIKYLRKCLEERYKDPAHRQSALLRHKREGPPGTPPDTGMTTEELEKSLNRESKPGWGQGYTVKTTAEYSKVLSKRVFAKEGGLALAKEGILIIESVDAKTMKLTIRLPVVARVRPAEQDVTLEADIGILEANKIESELGINK